MVWETVSLKTAKSPLRTACVILRYGLSSPTMSGVKNTLRSGISPMSSWTTMRRRWTAMRKPSPVLVGALRRHWERFENADVYSRRRAWILPE